jgi:hypothetical protein
MDFLRMLQNPDDISQYRDTHVVQVFFRQIYQHVFLNPVVSEDDGIAGGFSSWDPTLGEKLDPEGGV